MAEKLGERVHGRGFKDEPPDAEENARNRHRASILDDEFMNPKEMSKSVLGEIPPVDMAQHLGLNWLSAPSLFFKKNKGLVLGVVAVTGALNWQKVADVAIALAQVFP